MDLFISEYSAIVLGLWKFHPFTFNLIQFDHYNDHYKVYFIYILLILLLIILYLYIYILLIIEAFYTAISATKMQYYLSSKYHTPGFKKFLGNFKDKSS